MTDGLTSGILKKASTQSSNKHDMRTSKTLSISMAPEQLREITKLAKKENRTLSELVREALRRYKQDRKPSAPVNLDLLAALQAVQHDAKRAGLDKMTASQINAEVSASRRERRNKKDRSAAR
jgi:metal-responsive CopG/Arc/MetJ family transcriptional regulator